MNSVTSSFWFKQKCIRENEKIMILLDFLFFPIFYLQVSNEGSSLFSPTFVIIPDRTTEYSLHTWNIHIQPELPTWGNAEMRESLILVFSVCVFVIALIWEATSLPLLSFIIFRVSSFYSQNRKGKKYIRDFKILHVLFEKNNTTFTWYKEMSFEC